MPAKTIGALVATMTLIAPSAQAQPRQAFDLVCTSAVSGNTTTFRFDLARQVWCYADCTGIWQIDQLADSVIVLHLHGKDQSVGLDITINRITAAYSVDQTGAAVYASAPLDQGRCVRAPFIGFPRSQF